jgi:hypothetical protein
MGTFENIVRPYQTPGAANEPTFAPVGQPPPIRLQVGRGSGANIKTPTGSYSAEATFYVEQKPTEVIEN